jgi:hypothetical protein
VRHLWDIGEPPDIAVRAITQNATGTANDSAVNATFS